MDDDVGTFEADISAELPDQSEWRPKRDPQEEARADEFERDRRIEAEQQFKRLKGEAQAIYGIVRGLPGVRSASEWEARLEKAGDEIGNGRFLVRCLGAQRYLDPEMVAVLLTLRQNLISDMPHATAADVMKIDAAVIAYYNMLRTQRWIGDLSLVVERDLFGEEPLSAYHGHLVGDRLEEQLRRLAEVMLPLQERATRMMIRSLEALTSAGAAGRPRGRRGRGARSPCSRKLLDRATGPPSASGKTAF